MAWLVLATLFLGQAVGAQEPTCKQLKSLGYLKVRASELESDPELQARLQELIVEDIRWKLESNPELAKCVEDVTRRPPPSPSSDVRRGNPPSTASSGGVSSGLVATYVATGLLLGLWGALVVR